MKVASEQISVGVDGCRDLWHRTRGEFRGTCPSCRGCAEDEYYEEVQMKVTVRECDSCGERVDWEDGNFPKGWGYIQVFPDDAKYEVCNSCLNEISGFMTMVAKAHES